jgi:hypothetical protein
MVIEWAVMGGAVMKAAASSAAGKMAGMLVEKGKAKIFPGELEKAIAAGFRAAIVFRKLIVNAIAQKSRLTGIAIAKHKK